MSYKPGDLTRGAARRVVRTGLDVVDRVTDWWELPLPAQLQRRRQGHMGARLSPAQSRDPRPYRTLNIRRSSSVRRLR